MVAAAPPLLFLAVFFVWPVATIIERGLRPDGAWDLSVFADVATDPSIRRVLWFTVWQAAVSTLMCVLIGLPGAAMFARYRFRGRAVLWSALLVPFVLPTVVVGVALLGLIGPGGVLGVDLSGTVWAILIGHVFFNYAVVVRTVGATWMTIDPRVEEAARTLGASTWTTFRRVTLPLLRPALAAASSIVFLFSFTSFGIVLLLGGTAHRTVEVEIYQQTARLLNLDVAAVLALLQLVLVVAVLWWFGRSQHRRAVALEQRRAEESRRPAVGWRARTFVAGNLVVIGALLGAPLVVLAVRAFSTPDGWGLGAFQSLGDTRRGSTAYVPPLDAVGNSLQFAAMATVLALVLGACAAWAIAGGGGRVPRWSRFADTALMVPLGTSAVTVGFGFLLTFDRSPFDLRSSVWIVPIVHAVVALPFVVRLLVPAVRAIDPRLHEAAAVLGASPGRVRRSVDAPILGRAVAGAAGFAFAVSLGEFGATAFLARPARPTLPVAVHRALGRPGEWSFAQAMALSAILMVLTVAVMLLVDRLRPPGVAEF
ncbi:MAG: iron ABC transporter permease [Acidimicrobiia bacterium]|nr:iron ABC transporter permease [Acidimicrobiia bacterium]